MGGLLRLRLSSTNTRLALSRRRLLHHLWLLLLLGQSFDQFGLLEELDNLGLKHAAQFLMSRLGQTHALEQVVLVTQSEFSVR